MDWWNVLPSRLILFEDPYSRTGIKLKMLITKWIIMDEQQSVSESVETSSLCEEERARKLFQACDGDGDGYIDRWKLKYY